MCETADKQLDDAFREPAPVYCGWCGHPLELLHTYGGLPVYGHADPDECDRLAQVKPVLADAT